MGWLQYYPQHRRPRDGFPWGQIAAALVSCVVVFFFLVAFVQAAVSR